MNRQQLVWLFFSFSGRIDRQSYALAGLLLYLARFYPVYRIAQAPDQDSATYWGGIFILVSIVSLVSAIPLSAKRLHDFAKPAWFAVLYVFADFFMYLALCFISGDRGPNRYGTQTNAPR